MICWTGDLFATRLSLLVHHHDSECVHGQGQSKSSMLHWIFVRILCFLYHWSLCNGLVLPITRPSTKGVGIIYMLRKTLWLTHTYSNSTGGGGGGGGGGVAGCWVTDLPFCILNISRVFVLFAWKDVVYNDDSVVIVLVSIIIIHSTIVMSVLIMHDRYSLSFTYFITFSVYGPSSGSPWCQTFKLPHPQPHTHTHTHTHTLPLPLSQTVYLKVTVGKLPLSLICQPNIRGH